MSYKTLIGAKSLRIRFDKIDGFTLFGPEKHDAIYNRIRYLISQKSGITYIISHNYARIKVHSMILWLYKKTLTLNNVIILIKSKPLLV